LTLAVYWKKNEKKKPPGYQKKPQGSKKTKKKKQSKNKTKNPATTPSLPNSEVHIAHNQQFRRKKKI